jgi:dihydroorotate dehydrogenase electron transfer subunit
MKVEQARIASQTEVSGGYRVLVLESPHIASTVHPGQFVHLRVPGLDAAVLRRPFSIFRAEGGCLSILYKCVGKGTSAMALLAAGHDVNLLGPLGTGFPADGKGTIPVLVAGGYGVAPLYFLGTRLAKEGVVFIGGACAEDVLCVEDFESLGWDVRTATEDGSLGSKGLVTDALDGWLKDLDGVAVPDFHACGPDGMLKAVGDRAMAGGWNAWLSLDKRMGCGVGACLACVQRVRNGSGKEKLARVCRDGPVFEAREIVWE